MRRAIIASTILIACVAAQAGTRADLSGDAVVDFQTTMDMPLMTVGNAGNPDHDHFNDPGGVAYTYNIGKFEVTAGQYTEFLNAVAATDTYGLYTTNMWADGYGRSCGVQRSGSPGSYTYSVAADWADRPVNYVNWGDAGRYANWLTNAMPTGAQDLTTTEDGSYFLNGATSDAELMAVNVPDAAQRAAWSQGPKLYYLLPSEDEWYKAAYHANDGVTDNYFLYPTSSDAKPGNDLLDPDPGNKANFDPVSSGDYTIGSPYWRTEVGEFENSDSPYGTFDMAGNVSEWNEAIFYVKYRCIRGGSFLFGGFGNDNGLYAASSEGSYPTHEDSILGFRIAEVPEPASAALLLTGALAILRRRRRR